VTQVEARGPSARERDLDPTRGAARREGFLIAAFALLTLVGLWTVAVAEFAEDMPPPRNGQSVSAPTESPAPDTK
jgi:hypothetical protein